MSGTERAGSHGGESCTMSDANLRRESAGRSLTAAELENFRGIRRLRSHWARTDHGPAYYWYLTFKDCNGLHVFAHRVRSGIRLPHFDFTPTDSLHMTLDRIGSGGIVPLDRIRAIAAVAADACRDVAPFDINLGGLGGTPGALGLVAFPREPVHNLRDTVRAATLSVIPDAPVRQSEFHPHVALAVEQLSTLDPVVVAVEHVALVLVERGCRTYTWRPVARIPLRGQGRSGSGRR